MVDSPTGTLVDATGATQQRAAFRNVRLPELRRVLAETISPRYIAAPMYEYFTNTSEAMPASSSTPCTAVSMYFESQPM